MPLKANAPRTRCVSCEPAPVVLRTRVGFTVIELLIAALVMSVILLATTGLLVQSNQAYRVNELASERQQEIEAAVKILSYDLALAGYRGTTSAAFGENVFTDATVEVEKGGAAAAGSDKLIVRYFEDTDRLFGGQDTCGTPCVVTYDVDDEGGVLLLYRREGTSEERGIVQEVRSFVVRQYITRAGKRCPFVGADPEKCPPFPEDLAALNVEITFTDGGVWRFPVGVSNPQSP